MGALNIDTLYGVMKGVTDQEKQAREQESHETTQAINKENLRQSQDMYPIRRQEAETRLTDAQDDLEHNRLNRPLQREVTQKQLTAAGYTAEQAQLTLEQYKKAVKESDLLKEGTRSFYATKNPQDVLDKVAEFSPAHKGTTAVRNQDRSITINTPDGKNPMHFKSTPGGLTADAQFLIWAQEHLDPRKAIEKHVEGREKIEAELRKQAGDESRAVAVENVRERGRNARARDTTTNRNVEREVGRIKSSIDTILKVKGLSGEYMMGGTSPDDAPLVGVITERVRRRVNAGENAHEAANAEVNAVSQLYTAYKKGATELAAKLGARKIDYRNLAAVEELAKNGDPEAKGYLNMLTAAGETLGPRVRVYLTDTIFAPRKK